MPLGVPVLHVDAGDMLFGRPTVAGDDEAQRKIKGELLIEASAKLGVDALTVGEGDLVFGVPWLRAMAEKHGAHYVSANLRDASGAQVFPATRIVTKGRFRVGITGATLDTITAHDGRFAPPKEALAAAVAALRAEGVDFVVALLHAGADGAEALAQQVPGIDLVFAGHSRRHQEQPVIVGGAAIFEAGSRGKTIGEVRLDLKPGGKGWSDPGGAARQLAQRQQLQAQIARYDEQIAAQTDDSGRQRLQRVREFTKAKLDALPAPAANAPDGHGVRGREVPMDRGLADQPAMASLVDAYLAKLGPGESGNPMRDALAAPLPLAKAKADYGDWVGARPCMGCHPAQHKDWLATGHARAYAALTKDARQFDNDCWSCHVTGAGKPGGPAAPTEVGPLVNVQCEACHGPARAHVAAPSKANVARAPDEALCRTCHTKEQDEGRFDHATYRPRIDHVP